MKVDLNQYMLWKLANGVKLPCNLNGDVVSAHDSVHWTDYTSALAVADIFGDTYGVAFVLTEADPHFLVDIDHALTDGAWSPLALDLCNKFNGAHIEVSQSGTGLHIIGTYSGDAPIHACKNKALGIELYTKRRLVALGNTSTARGDPLHQHNEALARTAAQHFPPSAAVVSGGSWTVTHHSDSDPILDDDVLIAKAMKTNTAANAFGNKASFKDLWTCNVEALARSYPGDTKAYGESEADAALAAHLSWWTGANSERVEKLMRKSALARDKWDAHKGYMNLTVGGATARAVANGDFYRQTRKDKIPTINHSACDKAKELAELIKTNIEFMLSTHWKVEDEAPLTVTTSAEAIDQVITRSFWSGAKSKLFVLSDDGALNTYREQDMLRLVQKHFGSMWEQSEIDDACAAIDSHGLCVGAENAAFKKSIINMAINTITDHLKMHNQRERIDVRVDMFADRPRMIWYPEKVVVVFTWSSIAVTGHQIDQNIIADYVNHFPQLEDMLSQIVASRFASNRKCFYTWIKCPSDWGKGLFTNVLSSLGVCVELSVSECEKAFEGAPLGRDASEFTRAFVILFDEFKAVKSELKQLENEIPITPKNQLKQSVEIFTKLFTSAENVDSLTGENGVEDQFANRFSFIEGTGTITEREVFKKSNQSVYAAHIKEYIAIKLNELVDSYIAMGRDAAVIAADKFGADFHHRNGITREGSQHQRLSHSLPQISSDWVKWVIRNHQATAAFGSEYLVIEDNCYYIKRASKLYNDWVFESYSRSEQRTIALKKNEVFKIASECGGGVLPQRVNGSVGKFLKVGL